MASVLYRRIAALLAGPCVKILEQVAMDRLERRVRRRGTIRRKAFRNPDVSKGAFGRVERCGIAQAQLVHQDHRARVESPIEFRVLGVSPRAHFALGAK